LLFGNYAQSKIEDRACVSTCPSPAHVHRHCLNGKCEKAAFLQVQSMLAQQDRAVLIRWVERKAA